MCTTDWNILGLPARGSVRHDAQQDKRRDYFLKGPITFGWIKENIPDPASRVVLVARAFMDMQQANECALTAKVWDCAGVSDRYQRRRVLKRLREEVRDYEVVDRRGRTSVLRRRSVDRGRDDANKK